jgi:hypothetical protein
MVRFPTISSVACRYAVTSEKVMADPILFGDYRNVLADPDTAPGGAVLRLYEDVGSYSSIQPLFESVLAAYNQKHKPMQLVFFDDALEHLTRIQRTLRLPLVSCTCLSLAAAGIVNVHEQLSPALKRHRQCVDSGLPQMALAGSASSG